MFTERGGRFTDALSFYEAVVNDSSFDTTDKLFARQRWLRSKQRQLEYEKTRGALVKTEQIEREIQQGKAALSIKNLDELDEFPKLPQLDISVEHTAKLKTGTDDKESLSLKDSEHSLEESDSFKSDPLMVTIGSFRFEFSRKLQRCNIVHTENMTTAFIKLKELQCGGEVEFKRADGGRWECASWKLVVEFPKPESESLIIDLEQSGVQFRLRV
jgi:hypothetical protein